jgi:hypothetical protein
VCVYVCARACVWRISDEERGLQARIATQERDLRRQIQEIQRQLDELSRIPSSGHTSSSSRERGVDGDDDLENTMIVHNGLDDAGSYLIMSEVGDRLARVFLYPLETRR